MTDERHDMVSTLGGTVAETWIQYVNVYFPGLGHMAITYETRGGRPLRPVISVDFDVSKVDVLDSRGNDRRIN